MDFFISSNCDISCDGAQITLRVRVRASFVFVCILVTYRCTGLRRPIKRVLMPTRSPGHKGVF
ncbi:hypothetical protein T01_4446 [Trichinella spiralis]|uniref:Uncharacterized protein n=2 Tax=Trichinella spiralis TaxID=6334 RepID=A0A0V1ALU5_TRISP|nr:hypothetical protein T01_4446 [Trichinella spiralis]